MRKFSYRAPRFQIDLPVRLVFDGASQTAHCKEISTEGMKLELRQPLTLDSRGHLHIRYLDFVLDLQFQVTYSSSSYDGVKFIYKSEQQREEVARLVGLLSARQDRPGPILLQ